MPSQIPDCDVPVPTELLTPATDATTLFKRAVYCVHADGTVAWPAGSDTRKALVAYFRWLEAGGVLDATKETLYGDGPVRLLAGIDPAVAICALGCAYGGAALSFGAVPTDGWLGWGVFGIGPYQILSGLQGVSLDGLLLRLTGGQPVAQGA